jgi:hypothetical protein
LSAVPYCRQNQQLRRLAADPPSGHSCQQLTPLALACTRFVQAEVQAFGRPSRSPATGGCLCMRVKGKAEHPGRPAHRATWGRCRRSSSGQCSNAAWRLAPFAAIPRPCSAASRRYAADRAGRQPGPGHPVSGWRRPWHRGSRCGATQRARRKPEHRPACVPGLEHPNTEHQPATGPASRLALKQAKISTPSGPWRPGP